MIAAVYFSPTGNSRRSAVALAEAWAAGAEIGRVDLTDWRTSWEPRSFTAEDFVVFAAPVYAGRLPDVSLERFRSLRGKQTPSIFRPVVLIASTWPATLSTSATSLPARAQ